MRVLWLALLLIGCQSAQPQPDWTPPRAQVLSEKGRGHDSESDRESLAVSGLPKPRRPAPQSLPVSPRAAKSESPPANLPDPFVPTAVAHSAWRPQIAVPSQDVPEVSSNEGNVLVATAETSADALAGAGQTEIVFVMVELSPHGPQVTAGCDLALLVDVSGSVLHSDMEAAVRATTDIFAQQGSANRTWLIAFGSEAQMLVDGLRTIPTGGQLDGLLRHSRPAGGGTLLVPAIQLAVENLRRAPVAGQARHVVVVSDGELGDSNRAGDLAYEAWKGEGISFSGILVGGSAGGEAVLRGMADTCNGQFERVQGMAGAGRLLKEQADRARSILLRDLRLQSKLAPGVSIRRAFLVDPVRELTTAGGDQEVLKLGDFHRGEKRRVLLELQVKAGVGKERALAWISLLSKGPDAKDRAPQVLQQVRILNGTKKPSVNPAVDQCVDLVYKVISRRR